MIDRYPINQKFHNNACCVENGDHRVQYVEILLKTIPFFEAITLLFSHKYSLQEVTSSVLESKWIINVSF